MKVFIVVLSASLISVGAMAGKVDLAYAIRDRHTAGGKVDLAYAVRQRHAVGVKVETQNASNTVQVAKRKVLNLNAK